MCPQVCCQVLILLNIFYFWSQGSTGDDFRAGAGPGTSVQGRGRGAIGDVHTTTPAPVTRRGRGRGDRANHGKTKYLRVDGNHANHKKTNYSCFGGCANQNSAVSRSRDVLAVARYDVIPGRRAPARRRGFAGPGPGDAKMPGPGPRRGRGRGPGRSLLISKET